MTSIPDRFKSPIRMRPFRPLKLALLLAGLGYLTAQQPALAQTARNDADKPKPQATKPAPVSSADFLFQSFLSELAAHRGDPELAVSTYLSLARKANDPRLASRATEIALQAQNLTLANEAVRIWLNLEPTSQLAQQIQSAITAEATKTLAELESMLEGQLAKQVKQRPALLMQLPQLMARYQDTKANRDAIFRLTELYRNLPESHYVRAIAAAMAQDNATAIAEAHEAQTLRPDWEDAAMLSWRLTPADKRAEGIEILHQFGLAHPQAADARLTYARWLTSEKRPQEALAEARKLMQDVPDNNELHYAVAGLFAELEDWSAAEQVLRELITKGFRATDLLKLQLAELVEQQKRPAEAIQLYSEVPVGEHYPTAVEREARLLHRQGQVLQAYSVLEQAMVEQADKFSTFEMVKADLLRQDGKFAEAYALLDKVLAAEPSNLDALYMSALIADSLKHYDQMEQRLQQLIQLKPDYAQAYNALGYSYLERNVKLDEAAVLLDKAIKLSPEDGAILDSMAWLRFRQGNWADAKQFAERSMAILDDPEVQAHYVEILWASGNKDQAQQTFRTAHKNFPNNPALEAVRKKLGLKP